MTDFTAIQKRLWANKLAKGFNTTDVPYEFMLLTEEVGEASSAWRKDKPDYGGELADIALFVFSLAEMAGLDLGAEVEKKMTVNEKRVYGRLPNGTPVKAEADR